MGGRGRFMALANTTNYVIICDESSRYGRYYSYFYGGAMLLESKYEKISNILDDYKAKFGFHEIKRTKITTENYKDYVEVLDLFFTFVKSGDIKVRVMFSPNDELKQIPKKEDFSFMKFYYTFIVNAFNIFYAKTDIRLRLIFDDLPETKEQCKHFKESLMGKINLNMKPNTNRAWVNYDHIEEVDSKNHVILQCVDVVIGLVDFYLNTTTEEIQNSRRAQAKLKVWRAIEKNIYDIIPDFDVCRTTQPVYSHKGWLGKYRHFVYAQKK